MLVALGRDEAACLRLHRAAAAILDAAANPATPLPPPPAQPR